MERFKAALVCGRQPKDNPEPLVRDDKGDFVLYNEALNAVIYALEEGFDRDSIISNLSDRFGLDIRGFLGE